MKFLKKKLKQLDLRVRSRRGDLQFSAGDTLGVAVQRSSVRVAVQRSSVRVAVHRSSVRVAVAVRRSSVRVVVQRSSVRVAVQRSSVRVISAGPRIQDHRVGSGQLIFLYYFSS